MRGRQKNDSGKEASCISRPSFFGEGGAIRPGRRQPTLYAIRLPSPTPNGVVRGKGGRVEPPGRNQGCGGKMGVISRKFDDNRKNGGCVITAN